MEPFFQVNTECACATVRLSTSGPGESLRSNNRGGGAYRCTIACSATDCHQYQSGPSGRVENNAIRRSHDRTSSNDRHESMVMLAEIVGYCPHTQFRGYGDLAARGA
jgi:hypothetical protein